MAEFKTHLTGGIISGAGFSLFGLLSATLTLTQAVAIFIIGTFAGLLPDLDSDSGKPLAFIFQLLSLILPIMFFYRATEFMGASIEFLISYFTLAYLFVKYVICAAIKKLTVHRGMMHSVPFAVLCGALGYLLFNSSGQKMAFISGLALFSGCLIHLLLDELNSFTFKYGFIPVLKKSSGTALKFTSSSLSATIFMYSLLILVIISGIIET